MINNWRSRSALLSSPMPLNQPSQSACWRNENHKSIISICSHWIQRWKCLNKLEVGSKEQKKKKEEENSGSGGPVGPWQRFYYSGRTTPGSARVLTAVNAQAACIGNTHTHTHTHTHMHTHFAALICCSGGVHRDTHSSPQIRSALGVCVYVCVCALNVQQQKRVWCGAERDRNVHFKECWGVKRRRRGSRQDVHGHIHSHDSRPRRSHTLTDLNAARESTHRQSPEAREYQQKPIARRNPHFVPVINWWETSSRFN